MATTTVKGEITRTFFDGRGAEVTEKFTVKDKEITKRWACWFTAEHGLLVGQQVEVSGLHDDKVDSWDKDGETRHGVKRSLNKARVVGEVQAAPEPQDEPWATREPAVDAWPATETPF